MSQRAAQAYIRLTHRGNIGPSFRYEASVESVVRLILSVHTSVDDFVIEIFHDDGRYEKWGAPL